MNEQRAILNDANSSQSDKDAAQRILSQIEEDAKHIGDEFDELKSEEKRGVSTTRVPCATCWTNYQNCINNGGVQSVCYSQYLTCKSSCI